MPIRVLNCPTGKESLSAQLAAANSEIASLKAQLRKCIQQLDAKESQQVQQPAKKSEEAIASQEASKAGSVVFLDVEGFRKQARERHLNHVLALLLGLQRSRMQITCTIIFWQSLAKPDPPNAL